MTHDAQRSLDAILNTNDPLKRKASDWARANLSQDALVDADRGSTFDRDSWVLCAQHGFLGGPFEPEFGGRGLSLVDTLLQLEGLGHGCADNGLVFGITSQLWSTQNVIHMMGTSAQKRRWLPGLCDGSVLGAFAITEPDTGSDAYALAATAQPQPGGGYVINGHKSWLTLGPVADVVVVFANTSTDHDVWGVSAFIVDTQTPGVECRANQEKMGMRTTPFGDIVFNDVRVEEDARLGEEGVGMGIFNQVMQADRALVLAGQIGAMERQLEQSIKYARSRRQFGQAIRNFQAVSHRLADMKLRHEVARTMMYKTAVLAQAGRNAAMAASPD